MSGQVALKTLLQFVEQRPIYDTYQTLPMLLRFIRYEVVPAAWGGTVGAASRCVSPRSPDGPTLPGNE